MQEDTQNKQEQSWKARQKEQLRQELISTAVKLFEEKEFEAPSVDEITSRTGVAKGTFYLYFKTKADIMTAILENVLEQMESRIGSVMSQAPADAPLALRTVLKTQASFMNENPVALSLMSGRQSVLGQLDAQARTELEARLRAITVQVYERFLRTGILQRHYREIDPVMAARGLEAMFTSLLGDAIKIGQGIDEAVEMVADLFENGVVR